LDDAAIAHAREIFTEYHRRGIILNESFDDPTWKLSNETLNVTLALLSFENGGSVVQEWLDVPEKRYLECVKAYIALKLGERTLTAFRGLTKTLVSLQYVNADSAAALTKNASYVAEFLSLLPGGTIERDCVEEALCERVKAYNRNSGAESRRVLAAFNSYLQFDEILEDYWRTARDDEKLFYFPLYFWWNLTTILPLRPTEFLLTPRDCLDGNTVTVRRTRLKGGANGVNISHRIAQDYEFHRYEITPALICEINRYIKLTEKLPPVQIDALFRLEPHYVHLGRNQDRTNRYYTYHNMRTCLDTFFEEIAKLRGTVGRINLGDTRHIAMISLIISGGSPTVCRELAGHADINVSSHYYANISNVAESVTIGRFRKSKGGGAEFEGKPRYPLKRPDNMLRLAEGWCDSESVKNGEVGECMKVADSRGRIGECANCGHYWSDTPGIRARFFDIRDGKQRIDLDSAFLMRMIELVRKDLGCEEDITSALLRLQHSCNHLSDCLTMEHLNAEVK